MKIILSILLMISYYLFRSDISELLMLNKVQDILSYIVPVVLSIPLASQLIQ